MTSTQEEQFRAILEIEGFTPEEIERGIASARRRPDLAEKFLAIWKLSTETIN